MCIRAGMDSEHTCQILPVPHLHWCSGYRGPGHGVVGGGARGQVSSKYCRKD